MAFGTNQLIEAADYNQIRNTIIAIMGTGSGNKGYGQTIMSSAVSAGTNRVTKQDWDNLRYDIVNARIHQTNTTPSIANPSVGDVIEYGASHPVFQYQTLATAAETDRFLIGADQFSTLVISDATDTEITMPITATGTWQVERSATVTIEFDTGDQARYFFNSGGTVRFKSTRDGGSSTPQNSDWTSLLETIGWVSFGGGSPAINFWSLTTTDQTFYTRSSTAPYASNKFSIKAKLASGSTSSLPNPTQVVFTVLWTDGYIDRDVVAGNPATTNPNDGTVDGNLSLFVEQTKAIGNLLPVATPPDVQPAWTIALPSYTVSSITGS
jgi:hypothetical protein